MCLKLFFKYDYDVIVKLKLLLCRVKITKNDRNRKSEKRQYISEV